jgi:hypothetical protein
VYAYAGSDPQRFVDPDGLETEVLVPSAAAAIAGACAAGPISCGVAAGAAILAIGIMCMADRPRDFWPGDKGSEEWGRRNGIGKKKANASSIK